MADARLRVPTAREEEAAYSEFRRLLYAIDATIEDDAERLARLGNVVARLHVMAPDAVGALFREALDLDEREDTVFDDDNAGRVEMMRMALQARARDGAFLLSPWSVDVYAAVVQAGDSVRYHFYEAGTVLDDLVAMVYTARNDDGVLRVVIPAADDDAVFKTMELLAGHGDVRVLDGVWGCPSVRRWLADASLEDRQRLLAATLAEAAVQARGAVVEWAMQVMPHGLRLGADDVNAALAAARAWVDEEREGFEDRRFDGGTDAWGVPLDDVYAVLHQRAGAGALLLNREAPAARAYRAGLVPVAATPPERRGRGRTIGPGRGT